MRINGRSRAWGLPGLLCLSISVAVLVVVTLDRASSAPTSTPEAVTRDFFLSVRTGRYRRAYDHLSPSVRRDVPYGEFEARSRDIKWARVLELQATERSRNLVRYRVKGRLRLVYKGELFEAVYAGKAALSLNRGEWHIDEVELKPTQQKRLRAYRL